MSLNLGEAMGLWGLMCRLEDLTSSSLHIKCQLNGGTPLRAWSGIGDRDPTYSAGQYNKVPLKSVSDYSSKCKMDMLSH